MPARHTIPRAALVAPAGVLLLHVLLSSLTGAYQVLPWLDIPMHLAGGAAIAVAGRAILARWVQAGVTPPLERCIEALLLLGVTALAAVAWELAEFTLTLGWTTAQNGLGDTLLDLSMGVVGAALIAAGRGPAAARP